jgi:hypothetical protein
VRAPRVRGLAGAGLALTVWVTVGIWPTPLTPEVLPPLAPEPEPGPRGLVGAIDDRIHVRMPELADDVRRELARTIVLESETAHLDPLLVLAVIEVESAYDPAAISFAGAHGLMQLQEATMRREVERAGLPPADPHDPIVNVQAGVRYLRRLVDAFGPEVALMAYNAGPNRILGYLRDGGIPDRFQIYPRRVNAELRRLRRSVARVQPGPALARSGPAAAVAE